MNVLIIGFENAGSGIAADLSLKGHLVNVLKTSTVTHLAHFKKSAQSNRLTFVEHNRRANTHLSCITDQPERAFAPYPDAVIVTTQSLQHEQAFSLLEPFLRDDTVRLLEPGNAGTLIKNYA